MILNFRWSSVETAALLPPDAELGTEIEIRGRLRVTAVTHFTQGEPGLTVTLFNTRAVGNQKP